MAPEESGMTRKNPPGWLDRLLRAALPQTEYETISGDLLEEYRERPDTADHWYLRQVVGIVVRRAFGYGLTAAGLFTALSSVWLVSMELVLRHAGYEQRVLFDAGILVQSILTIVMTVTPGQRILRTVANLGAFFLLWLGASALAKNLAASHFEGFVVVIATALVLQAGLTWLQEATRHLRST